MFSWLLTGKQGTIYQHVLSFLNYKIYILGKDCTTLCHCIVNGVKVLCCECCCFAVPFMILSCLNKFGRYSAFCCGGVCIFIVLVFCFIN